MMKEAGKQYSKDDLIDKSGFLAKARRHQSKYRAEKLMLDYDSYGNYLRAEDGIKGKNFYDGFGVFEAVQNYRKYNKPLYSNMLRSEHIPFNFFVPFKSSELGLEYCKHVLNEFLAGTIGSVKIIEIEYVPDSKKFSYLKDKTSFDVYIEYTHVDGSNSILGVEVKYTEQGYKLKDGSTEQKALTDPTHPYQVTTQYSGIYNQGALPKLQSDTFRQIWRNHMLGESILMERPNDFKHFTSLTLFPQGNSHFVRTSKEYIEMLEKESFGRFVPVTFEAFFTACKKFSPSSEYGKWQEYLMERYLVS